MAAPPDPIPAGRALAERARTLIPGGAHTYAKGFDQFPTATPPFLVRGKGCHVWDADGRELIEYGMGMRAVTLGHACPPVLAAVKTMLDHGTNFTRPAPIEVECAAELQRFVRSAEMVKFCKDGSLANDGAVRLARAWTGRDLIAVCEDQPFLSGSDWFIGSTAMPSGVPAATRRQTLRFRYNDLASLEALYAAHPGEIACVVMEAARAEEPTAGFLAGVARVTREAGALLVLDEMITGFRWHLHGAQHVYDLGPDLSTFGKALANGFAVSALVGRRDVMELGGFPAGRERVFLLSTTHGAETHALAAALATMRFYETHPVIETLYARGAHLRRGVADAIAAHDLGAYVSLAGRDCNLLYVTRDAEGRPSQAFRALFLQELARRGVLAPSFVVSYAHAEPDIDRTIAAADEALGIYRRALVDGVERHLIGPPVKPVFRPFA
jgi:glutamate-1-semialdehyde 2,1-aminomutase